MNCCNNCKYDNDDRALICEKCVNYNKWTAK